MVSHSSGTSLPFESRERQWRRGGLVRVRERIADLRLAQLLPAGDDEADLARRKRLALL